MSSGQQENRAALLYTSSLDSSIECTYNGWDTYISPTWDSLEIIHSLIHLSLMHQSHHIRDPNLVMDVSSPKWWLNNERSLHEVTCTFFTVSLGNDNVLCIKQLYSKLVFRSLTLKGLGNLTDGHLWHSQFGLTSKSGIHNGNGNANSSLQGNHSKLHDLSVHQTWVVDLITHWLLLEWGKNVTLIFYQPCLDDQANPVEQSRLMGTMPDITHHCRCNGHSWSWLNTDIFWPV